MSDSNGWANLHEWADEHHGLHDDMANELSEYNERLIAIHKDLGGLSKEAQELRDEIEELRRENDELQKAITELNKQPEINGNE